MSVIKFCDITLNDKPVFDNFFEKAQYAGSECTFTNLFIWRRCYNIHWTQEDGFLLIEVLRDNEWFILPPFGGKDENLPGILAKIYKQFGTFEMRGIYKESMERLERVLPQRFQFIPDRDNSDYIYASDDLANLSGRKYHQKKNHANSFRKAYPDYQYVSMTGAMAKDCIDFARNWKESRVNEEDPESLECEMFAIEEALNNFDFLGIKGGVILINGKIEAITFGEIINKETAIIHVEKANPEIRGLYAVINQEFCRHEWSGLKYINREEDMGLEGLRKAKESYHPAFMLDKYTACVDMGE